MSHQMRRQPRYRSQREVPGTPQRPRGGRGRRAEEGTRFGTGGYGTESRTLSGGRSYGQGFSGGQAVGGGRGVQTGLVTQPQQAQYPDTFVDHLTREMRMVLDDSIEVSQVATWCADKCIDHGPEMADCIRLCNEVAEIAELNAKLISKDGYNVLPVTELFVDVAEKTIDELDRFQQPHTEETAAVLDRAIGSSIDLLETA